MNNTKAMIEFDNIEIKIFWNYSWPGETSPRFGHP